MVPRSLIRGSYPKPPYSVRHLAEAPSQATLHIADKNKFAALWISVVALLPPSARTCKPQRTCSRPQFPACTASSKVVAHVLLDCGLSALLSPTALKSHK